MSEDEWAALPEAGNLTGKRRKAAAARESRDTRGFVVPDSVLVGARDQNAVEASLSGDQMEVSCSYELRMHQHDLVDRMAQFCPSGRIQARVPFSSVHDVDLVTLGLWHRSVIRT